MTHNRIVSEGEWIEARRALLVREKELTRMRDAIARDRQALPWIEITKPYVFEGPQGPVTLAELFDGRSQLFIKHFMMGPGQQHQCVGCAFEADHVGGILAHLQNHDVTYAAVARAPYSEIAPYKARMGWTFPWVSSFGTDFNYDMHVSFRPEDRAAGRALYNFRECDPGMDDLSGDSVFYKDEDGRIFQTYSVFSRGGEDFLGAYRILDATPKGRNEHGPYFSLGDWVRPHDKYGKGGMVEPTGRYHEASCGCSRHT